MKGEQLVRFEENQGIVVGHIGAASVLDAANVDQFGAEVIGHVKGQPRLSLLLDFGEVDYLSSAVLTELIRINETLAESQGNLRLCGLNKDIRKVFEITNLDKLFIIYDTVPEGIKRFLRSLEVAAEEETWAHLQKDS